MPKNGVTLHIQKILLIFISHFILSISSARDDGLCSKVDPLDVYLLIPTSAHVSKSRLNEVKTLLNNVFKDADFEDEDHIRIKSINYKKMPSVAFNYQSFRTKNDFITNLDKEVVIKARAAPKESPPTFATDGLKYFMSEYQTDIITQDRRPGVPAVLLFFVIESLNRQDLNNMASNLVRISSELDVFSFIFIANPNGQQSHDEPKFSLPHSSWNALAVDDNSNIDKYEDVLRQTVCRCSHGNLCLMLKEQNLGAKTEKIEQIQQAARTRTATNNRQAKADNIVVKPNACCNELIFSKTYDNRVQKCCAKNNDFSVVEIDDEC